MDRCPTRTRRKRHASSQQPARRGRCPARHPRGADLLAGPTGVFNYRIPGLVGLGAVLDPESSECLNIGEATAASPVDSPKNLTDQTATVFLDFDCDGDTYAVLPAGAIRGTTVQFRSVVFN
ncbi:hypothetical protein ACFWGM_37050 [Streptomyces roseolus]|uniref:hypothetical protein n=1 Tax=Streptomyces roseolus TaxID=67358 RepID=UPI0036327481